MNYPADQATDTRHMQQMAGISARNIAGPAMEKPKRQKSIPQRLEQIYEQGAILDKHLDDLDLMLQPILREDPPTPENCKTGQDVVAGPNCGLDNKLDQIRCQFIEANRRLQYFTNHIEL